LSTGAPPPHPHRHLLAVVLLVVVSLDQATKAAVRVHLELGETIPILGPLLQLTHAENRGIAWGLLKDSGWRLPFMTVVSLLTFVVLAAWFRRLGTGERALAWTLSLLMAGALGNFVDRLLYREVTDFVAVAAPAWLGGQWPVFNVADVAITTAIALFGWNILFHKAHSPELP
jgi:signal peptidase II